MINIINKVLKREEDKMICTVCEQTIDSDVSECPHCGYVYEDSKSTPEKNMDGVHPEQ